VFSKTIYLEDDVKAVHLYLAHIVLK